MRSMRNLRKLGSVILLSVLFFLAGCSKTEFLPDPEGSKIPFQNEATKTVEELLAASSAKIYYQAWQRSNFKNTLAAKGIKFDITIFAPDDAAMQAAGFTAAVVQQMPMEELDNLLMFYTTIGKLNAEILKGRTDNYVVKSMLQHPGLYVQYFENPHSYPGGYDDFFYSNYMAVEADDLFINGKSTGKLNYYPATNGALYILGKAIEKPVKTKLQALIDDGRFGMFLESQRLTDEMYLKKIGDDLELLFGYRIDSEEIKRDYAYDRLYYDEDMAYVDFGYPAPNIVVSALFAPTDEAFHKAGFQTVEDILRFNRERGDARFDENTFQIAGGYPLDTILNFHRDWGRFFAPRDPSYGLARNNATVFYSNVLNPSLQDYMVNIGGNSQAIYGYKMPLSFSMSNNKTQIQVPGSDRPAATVLEADINTLNGPIHVVDQLLIPKGFKLN
jgi:hypothetical protein